MAGIIRRLMKRIYVSPEEEVLSMVLEHSVKCRDAARHLRELLELAVEGKSLDQKIAEIERAERDADKLRRAILDHLAEGALPPLSREDFVRLVERVDMVADWSREAARILRALECPSCLRGVSESLLKLGRHAEEAAEKLYEAVRVLGQDLRKARELVAEVERIEDKGDWAYAECLAVLSKHWEDINNPLVMVLVQDVENVVDAAEDASDVLEEIIIRALR